jgi:hypothetical protein
MGGLVRKKADLMGYSRGVEAAVTAHKRRLVLVKLVSRYPQFQ